MAMNLRLPADLDAQLEAIAIERHTSKHALVLQGARWIVATAARRAELDSGLDFVLRHDAELLERLDDA